MTMLAAARRWFLNAARRSGARGPRGIDPADMGTAFGLDAITTLESDATPAAGGQPGTAGAASDGRPWSPFEPRPPRRGAY